MDYRIKLPEGPFGTIYADPPWMLRSGGVKRKLHYDTMTTEQIAAIPVSSVCAPYAHCWLWATNPHLPEALRVLESWGFTYKTMLTWDKELMGLGWWLRSRTEHVLFGVRGRGPRVSPNRYTTLHRSRRRKHSEKPDEVRNIIRVLSPGPYLELFARAPADGWTCLTSDAPPDGDPYSTGLS